MVFQRLSTKLTVLFGALFVVTFLSAGLALYWGVGGAARSALQADLKAGGAVFDRLWDLRSRRLEDAASLLARDFGFRAAVATGDTATVRSALENLQARAEVDNAFIVGVDGKIVTSDGAPASADLAALANRLDPERAASGVIRYNGGVYQAVSTPILTPVLTGWVVFAVRLDAGEMHALERLSAIPIDATILTERDRNWAPLPQTTDGVSGDEINRFVASSMIRSDAAPSALSTRDGPAAAIVKPLASLDGQGRSVLMLRYPISRAMAAYRPVIVAIAATGVVCIFLLAVGSLLLARAVTRPVSQLDLAAQRLQRGEQAQVEITSGDELGRLADSFNAMAVAIGDREREITHLALHDAASGLPNRRTLERTLEEALSARSSGVVAVFALRLQRHSHVRGAIGFALFNQLFKALDDRFGADQPGLHLAQLSSDVLGGVFTAADESAARRLADGFQSRLEGPIRLGFTTVDANFRLGLALSPLHGEDVGALLERAEIAVDQAEAAGRRLAVFDPLVYGDPASNLSLMSEMIAAIENRALSVHLQPKFDLRARRITGAEALVRWRHPTRGPLSPDLFVGMAEETGHIRALTEWVLEESLQHQQVLADLGRPLTLSVNISGRLLSDPDFVERALRRVSEAAGRVAFEITETAVIDNPDMALAMIERFHSAGVEVSIDDYGTGLSSLAYLKQIPAHELKIDKAFVMTMDQSQKDALLVKSTIDLAHSLGLKVTAEGVETPAALALLTGMGCDLAQGYFIARPMALDAFVDFVGADAFEEKLKAARSA